MIRRKTIQSCPDASCPRPWVEFSDFAVTPTGVRVSIARCTGVAAAPFVAAGEDRERALETTHLFAFDTDALSERHALAITLEGELELVPFSKQRQVYYAHLAFIDPETGDAEVLKFEADEEHEVPKENADPQHLQDEA